MRCRVKRVSHRLRVCLRAHRQLAANRVVWITMDAEESDPRYGVKKLLQRLRSESNTVDWITPSLIVCAYPHDEEEMAALASQGISLLINLHTRPHRGEHLARHGMTEVHLPTRDFTAPKMDDVGSGIAALERAFAQGRRAAVHCGAGLGRTGTFVACYLVHTGMTAEAALEAVRRARPGSVETSGQEAFVRQYHGTKSRRTT